MWIQMHLPSSPTLKFIPINYALKTEISNKSKIDFQTNGLPYHMEFYHFENESDHANEYVSDDPLLMLQIEIEIEMVAEIVA